MPESAKSDEIFRDVGIDSFGFYAPKYYVELGELALSRKQDPNKYHSGLLLKEMRLPDVNEDIINFGFKAAFNALMRGNISPKEIDAVFVGTETITYSVKSVSNILGQMLGVSRNCVTQDIYNACAAGTLGLINAISMVDTGVINKALVIAADISQYQIGSPAEPTQGAGAFAMVISKNPRIAVFSKQFGKISADVNDFFRPAGEKDAFAFGKYSQNSYIKMQMGAFDDLSSKLGKFNADYFVFHAPFSKLPIKFITNMIIERSEHFVRFVLDSKPRVPRSRLNRRIPSIRYSFKHFPSLVTKTLMEHGYAKHVIERVVEKTRDLRDSIYPQLKIPMYFGNMYSASVWAQIGFLIEEYVNVGDVLYFGSYGSGALCLSGLIKILPRFKEIIKKPPKVEQFFFFKEKKTITEYEMMRNGQIKPNLRLGKIKPLEKYENAGIFLHFCDEGCLIPDVEGLNYCPKGHSGYHKVFLPYYAKLVSETWTESNLEQCDAILPDIIHLEENIVSITGTPLTSEKDSILELEFRRIEPDKNCTKLSDKLLNWFPIYSYTKI